MPCQVCIEDPRTAFVKWKSTVISINACEYHLAEVIHVLKEAQDDSWKAHHRKMQDLFKKDQES